MVHDYLENLPEVGKVLSFASIIRIAEDLNKDLNIRKEDVFISLVEVTKENWSFGNGEAQYAPK